MFNIESEPQSPNISWRAGCFAMPIHDFFFGPQKSQKKKFDPNDWRSMLVDADEFSKLMETNANNHPLAGTSEELSNKDNAGGYLWGASLGMKMVLWGLPGGLNDCIADLFSYNLFLEVLVHPSGIGGS